MKPVKNYLHKSLGIASTTACLWFSLLANNAGAVVTNAWDPTGLTVSATPTGSWDGSTSWAPTVAPVSNPGPFSEGAFAVFTAGTSGSGTFTVTANNNHTCAGIYNGGLTGITAGTLTISGSGTLTFASGLQGLGANANLTIANPIAGADGTTGIQFNGGGGQVFMNGNNTYAGGTFFVNTTLVNFNNNNAFGTGTINFNTGSSGGALIVEGTSAINITNAINIGATNATWSYNFVGNTGGVTYSGPFNLHTNVVAAGSGGATNNIDIFSGVISSTSSTGGFQRQAQSTAGIVKLTGANTYTGKSAFQSGITYVTTLNSVSTPAQQASASLGVPSSVANGTLSISSTTFPGTLVYVGSGETTDRVIDLAGTTASSTLENDGTGALTFTSANTASGAGNKTFILAGSYAGAANTISGPIVNSSSGATLLTKVGAGTWVLTGTNTYTGNTLITNGTLSIGGNGKLNSGTYSSNVANNATFLWNSTAAQTVSGVVSGAGNVIDTGSGTLSLSGANTLTGNVSIGSGSTIAITGAGTLGSTYSHSITNNGTFAWNSSASSTLSGVLSGSGAWSQGGSGTLTLSGTGNTFTGPISINNGLLAFTSDANLGAIPGSVTTNAITLNGGANSGLRETANNITLNGNRGITLGANGGEIQVASGDTFIYPGVIGGSGPFQAGQNSSTGLGVLVLGGNNTYTNTTTIACGTLRLGTGGSIASSSAIIMSNATTFDVSAVSPNPYSLGSSTFTGIGGAATTTTIVNVQGGAVNFGSQPITLSFVPGLATGDPTNAALTISQGVLSLNGNTFNVTNASALTLGVGNYTLIQQGNVNVNATGTFALNLFGTGIAPNTTASINVQGGAVVLSVQPTGANTNAFFTNLTANQTITYGTLNASVSGTVIASGPTYPTNGSPVNIIVGGVTNTTTINDNTGDFTFSAPVGTIPVGNYLITYSFAGDTNVPIGAATDTSTMLSVTKASLQVTATAQSKTYGQTVTTGAGNTNFSSTGLQNSETIGSVTLSVSSNGATATAPVSGSPYLITPSAATGGTFNANNYAITYNTGLLTVNPAPLTVTGNNASRLYGATNPVFGVTYTGFTNGQTLGTSDVGGSPSLVTAATNDSPIGAYDITNSLGTLTSTNYSFTFVDGTLTINPLPINLTGTRPYDGTNDADSSILTITTNYDGTNLTLSGSAVLTNSAAGTEAISDFSGLTLGGTAATNYTTTNATGSVIITTLPLTITANAQSKNYGQVLSLGDTAFTVGSGLIGSETVTAVTLTANGGTAATDPVSGSPYIITPSAATGINGFLAGNYNIAYVTNELTVSAVPLSISATPQGKTYGQTVVFGSGSVAFTSSGLSNSETIGSVTLACSGGVSNAPVSGSPYAITPTAATGGTFNPGNYIISYNPSLLTVGPALLTVTANDLTVPYGTTNANLTVTYSNFVNGEVLGTSDVAGSPALASDGLDTNSPIGTYVITNSTGTLTSTNYTFNLVNGTLTVVPLAVNLSGTRPYDGTNDADSSILTITTNYDATNLTLSGSAVLAGSAAGVEAISDFSGLSLGGTASTNYTLSAASGSVTITGAPLSITANPVTKTYGTAITLDPTAFTVGPGLVGSETVTAVTMSANGGTAATDPVSGSPYTITPSAATGINGFLAANYNIAYDTNTLTVNPLVAVLTGTRPYDGTATASFGILSVANVVGSDDVSVASGSGTLASAAIGTNAIVSFGTLALGGTTAPNYTLASASGSVLITNPHTPFTITSSTFDHVGTNIVIVYQSVPGVVYQVLSSPNVSAPLNTWTNEGSAVTAVGTLTTNVIPADTNVIKVYIVKDVQ